MLGTSLTIELANGIVLSIRFPIQWIPLVESLLAPVTITPSIVTIFGPLVSTPWIFSVVSLCTAANSAIEL